MIDLYEVIQTITTRKTDARVSPTYALELETRALYIGDSFDDEITTLITVGLVRTGKTINQNYYQLTEL